MFLLSASPMFCLGKNEKESLVGLADRLHQRVVGQTEAVNAVAEGVLRSRAGLRRPQQSTGSFLFLGTSCVGKTELSKGLAEHLFNDENLVSYYLLRMSKKLNLLVNRLKLVCCKWNMYPRLLGVFPDVKVKALGKEMEIGSLGMLSSTQCSFQIPVSEPDSPPTISGALAPILLNSPSTKILFLRDPSSCFVPDRNKYANLLYSYRTAHTE